MNYDDMMHSFATLLFIIIDLDKMMILFFFLNCDNLHI